MARSERDLHDLAATDPQHIVPMPMDATDPSVFDATFDSALVYAPAMSAESTAALRPRVRGISVSLMTSAAAGPDAAPLDPLPTPWHRLLLGWTGNPPRWHTPEEISAAALDVLGDGVDRVLGTVGPWGDRPS